MLVGSQDAFRHINLSKVTQYCHAILAVTFQDGAVTPSLDGLPSEVDALGFFLERDSALFSHRLNNALRELGDGLPLNRRLRRAVNMVLGACLG